ncbi:MAG: toll/interleukin-1 receptor domain-containing protein [Chitinophaga sp.]|uniref:toll/interleukin-1 receptor domain-containing protein n=1 Tax=Chitinophaga sp. TaxID=1869181 RepID=UPI001B0BA7D2|nr:toll/interleukin-1 receptor domain-containing protein [Chitinophaga sp.]MBO9733192.1 toll/interleukin-1 receptor domain-containing protein [Chitinophaga sp.]
MLKRKDYIDIIQEIRNTELLALDEFIERVLEPLRAANKYFDEILYKDISYLLEGGNAPGEGDLAIEDDDLVFSRGDIKLTGYQSHLHHILVWLHTNIVTKHLGDGNFDVFSSKMESFETDHLGRLEYTPEYRAMLDEVKKSLFSERQQNLPPNNMEPNPRYSASHELTFYTDPKNIPNQRLVLETIEHFTNGPGSRAFEALEFLNLLREQNEFVNKMRADTPVVMNQLKRLPFSDLQKHVLMGFILKWHGGYPVDNLDEDADRTLKEICSAFLAYPEATPEKEICKADVDTHKLFRYYESLTNTSFETGIPIDVLAKQTEFPFKKTERKFTSFNELYAAAIDEGLVPTPEGIESLAVQMVKKGTAFNNWLESIYQWHPADRERFSEFLSIEHFKKFLQATIERPKANSQETKRSTMNDQSKGSPAEGAGAPIKVFVTYAWEDDERKNETVVSFTDHLRTLGYEAVVDRLLSQNETATNFKTMMYKTLGEVDKVVVILTKRYKGRAERYEGGVGTELQYILSDIERHPKKYIFVSFDGYSDDVVPAQIRDREILDLKKSGAVDRLRHKLDDVPEIEFSNVATSKQKLQPKQINPFSIDSIEARADEQSESKLSKNLIEDGTEIMNVGLSNFYRFQATFAPEDKLFDIESVIEELQTTIGPLVMSFLPALNLAFRKSATHKEFLFIGDLSQPNVSGYQDIHAISAKNKSLTLEMVTRSSSSIVRNLYYELANCLAVIATIMRSPALQDMSGTLTVKLQTNSTINFTSQNSHLVKLGLPASYVFDEAEEVLSLHAPKYDIALFKTMATRLAKLFHLKSPNLIHAMPPLLKVDDSTLDAFVKAAQKTMRF